MDQIKERRLIDSVYMLTEMIRRAFSEAETRNSTLAFFYNTGIRHAHIETVYKIGIELADEERKIFWRNFIVAKAKPKFNYQDAISYAKLSVLIHPYHVNSR